MNLYDLIINHPGRILTLQCINYHCTAATPPSKGGETYTNLSCHNYPKLDDYAFKGGILIREIVIIKNQKIIK